MKKYYLTIIVLLVYIPANSQTFKLGFDIEAQQVRLTRGTLGGDGLLLAYHINLIYNPAKDYSLRAKIENTLHIEFAGWEFGISGKYNFYNYFLYQLVFYIIQMKEAVDPIHGEPLLPQY